MISEDNNSTHSKGTTNVAMSSSDIASTTVTMLDITITESPLLNYTEAGSQDDLFIVEGLGTTSSPKNSSDAANGGELSVAYTVSEAIVSLLAIFGNALVVYIFCKNRSLRRYRNYYIVALAIADFLVGLLGIPFAIMASVGLPQNLYGCLFTVSILMVLCTVSILCLVAVSIDRYWATTNPFAYYRNMTTTTAVSIILFCWVAGAIIGFLPLFGWYNKQHWEDSPTCYFTKVMDYNYLVFLYFATIVFPALLMIGFYGYIYHVVLIKIRQKGTLAPQHLRRFSEQSRTGSLSCENRSATQVLRIMVSEKRREAKAAKKLGIIVLFFMLCWMPLYTINCIQAFYPKFNVPIQLINFTIILSHANSALNPFLYAYHLKEFRMAMKHALMSLCGKLLCGLVNAHLEKENPLGPMSRSLTMPSLGNVTTVPNPTGKVSIKFRKISRPGDEPRSVQISPNNRNSMMMIPPAVTTGSRDNLLRTAGGTDKSLTSLSLASDASNQLLEISLQVTTSASSADNCRKSRNSSSSGGKNGSIRKEKSNNNGPMLQHNHLNSPPPHSAPPTTQVVHKPHHRNNSTELQTESHYSSSSETIDNCNTATTPTSTHTAKHDEEEEKGDSGGTAKNTNALIKNDLSKDNLCIKNCLLAEADGVIIAPSSVVNPEPQVAQCGGGKEEEMNGTVPVHREVVSPPNGNHLLESQDVHSSSNEQSSPESSHDEARIVLEESDVTGNSLSSSSPVKHNNQKQNSIESNNTTTGSKCISVE